MYIFNFLEIFLQISHSNPQEILTLPENKNISCNLLYYILFY
jgi:hypothetical protein